MTLGTATEAVDMVVEVVVEEVVEEVVMEALEKQMNTREEEATREMVAIRFLLAQMTLTTLTDPISNKSTTEGEYFLAL